MIWRHLAQMVAEHGAAALVTLHAARGSVPQAPGARLLVRPDGAFRGTIGGGELEWDALARARAALALGRGPAEWLRRALGPDLGQCCGGEATLLVETFDARDAADLARLAAATGDLVCRLEGARVRRESADAGGPPLGAWRERTGPVRTPLLLFGAGHVGRALVAALAPLPFAIRWIDPRHDAFPSRAPARVEAVRADDPAAEVPRAPAGAHLLVVTHAHPLDFAITAAALARDDLAFVGLIGSATKRARFERRWRALGLGEAARRLTCPIGLPGIRAKDPAIIAASVAAQLLQVREAGAVAMGRAA